MPEKQKSDQIILAEVQVLLAELRTYLSMLRLGVTLLATSLSVAFLITANAALLGRFSEFDIVIKIFLVLVALVGFWRLISSERKILRIHKLIREIEKKYSLLDDILV